MPDVRLVEDHAAMIDARSSRTLHQLDPQADPLFAAGLALRALELGDPDPARRLITDWATGEIAVSANPGSQLRYRWLTSTRFATTYPLYVPGRTKWRAWRPAEDEVRLRDPGRFEGHLIPPIVLADSIELLATVSETSGPLAKLAGAVLVEAMPAARRDIASFLGETHAWSDTWALWNVARRPHALRLLHPFALALADTYAERAIGTGSTGTGSRYPFHGRQLVSVSAQLATGLLALGFHPRLTGALVAFVRSAEDPGGGWGDADGPVDPLTTLVSADLLIGLDPSWNPSPALLTLGGLRDEAGMLTAYGPETGWLTTEVERVTERSRLPFDRRFRWPQLATQQRDRRTKLPWLGYLVDLEALFTEVESLRQAPVEMAFLDLAGFGDWNNRFGMAAGDDVLVFLADQLRTIPDSVAIRDGGDEFVIVGSPLGADLPDRMTEFRERFPDRFRGHFGQDAAPVAPRIVTLTVAGDSLVAGRDQLGRDIARLKKRDPRPGLTGVQIAAADLGVG